MCGIGAAVIRVRPVEDFLSPLARSAHSWVDEQGRCWEVTGMESVSGTEQTA
jgi:hypothetical protein